MNDATLRYLGEEVKRVFAKTDQLTRDVRDLSKEVVDLYMHILELEKEEENAAQDN